MTVKAWSVLLTLTIGDYSARSHVDRQHRLKLLKCFFFSFRIEVDRALDHKNIEVFLHWAGLLKKRLCFKCVRWSSLDLGTQSDPEPLPWVRAWGKTLWTLYKQGELIVSGHVLLLILFCIVASHQARTVDRVPPFSVSALRLYLVFQLWSESTGMETRSVICDWVLVMCTIRVLWLNCREGIYRMHKPANVKVMWVNHIITVHWKCLEEMSKRERCYL